MADHTDMLDLIRAAVARGYCHPVNSAKEVDAYLLEAIAYEVCAALPAEGLERAREDEAKVGWTLDMELLKELRSAAGDLGYSLDLEAVEDIALEVEKRLRAQQPAAPVSWVTVQEAGWQPIETAPHEELVVLGWQEDGVWKQEIALASAGKRLPNGYSNRWLHGRATHWMPLPEPPALPALEGK